MQKNTKTCKKNSENMQKIQTYKINRPPTVETEYSVHSTLSTCVGINTKDWPDND